MAIEPPPKQNSQPKSHSRNVTPVVPILPLLSSDRKWRKPSQAVNELPSPVPILELAKSSESSPVPKQDPEVHSTTEDIARDTAQIQEPPTDPVVLTNGYKESSDDGKEQVDGPPQAAFSDSMTTEPANESAVSATEGFLNSNEQARSRSSTLIAHEVGELADPSSPAPTDQTSANYTLREVSTQYDDLAVADLTQVPLSEEETQGSDPDNTSVQRSNTTGLTDYGSTTGDSSLETIVPEDKPTAKASQLTHRQSEVAPELLSNGHSPDPSREGKTSHQMSASVSSQPPRLPTLQEHLLFLATTKQACDLVIQLNQPDRAYLPSLHNVHSLFLMRSPRLAPILAESDRATATRTLNLFPVRNVIPHALDAALRFFYSDQTLTVDALLTPQVMRDKQAKAQSLDYVMSYWIAGIELGLDPIKARAYELVQQVVSWDTAELLVKEIQGLRLAEDVLPNARDKFEVRGIADTLLSLVIQLFIETLNMQEFKLDATAQVTAVPPRFSHLEHRPNNPALSAMVFGSLPAQTTSQSSPESVASSILLHMDYNDLQLLVSELISWHGTAAKNVLLYAIHLREERREQIVSNIAITNKDRLSHSVAWEPAGWREYIYEGRLLRERVGFLLPTRAR